MLGIQKRCGVPVAGAAAGMPVAQDDACHPECVAPVRNRVAFVICESPVRSPRADDDCRTVGFLGKEERQRRLIASAVAPRIRGTLGPEVLRRWTFANSCSALPGARGAGEGKRGLGFSWKRFFHLIR